MEQHVTLLIIINKKTLGINILIHLIITQRTIVFKKY